jgi:ABC-type antimicrobial peptide transport system permease subunit
LGLTPIVGRDLSPRDGHGAPAAAVVNAQLADELFPGRSAIGETLLIGALRRPVEVVGVAPNALFDGPLHDSQPGYVFTSLQQATDGTFVDMTFFVRHTTTLDVITPIVSRAIAKVDPSLPIVSMTTMTSRLDGVTVLERQVTTLLIAFAFTSLVVAALGQYAVAMFNMRRRKRDFGVRLALGASSRQIEESVIREAFGLTIPGLLIGFALSAATAVLARALLYGVTPVDPLTYAGVFVLLAVTSIAASYVPAWRAARVNVVDALRNE